MLTVVDATRRGHVTRSVVVVVDARVRRDSAPVGTAVDIVEVVDVTRRHHVTRIDVVEVRVRRESKK